MKNSFKVKPLATIYGKDGITLLRNKFYDAQKIKGGIKVKYSEDTYIIVAENLLSAKKIIN